MTIHLVTLGCSKNLVDSEHLMAQFRAAGHHVFHDSPGTEADVAIINTCGFILDAKQESIDTILEYTRLKEEGRLRKLFVMGCLSERYRDELIRELPEVDGFFGVWDWPKILQAAGSRLETALLTDRMVTTPAHYAYLKISEGCNRSCAFCAIPGIRGPQRSLSIDTLMEEGSRLAGKGVRELILIAQDLTGYGTDIYNRLALPELLHELTGIDGVEWIRLHYAYPAGFPEKVIDIMAGEEKVCNYMDMPIQHIDEDVLRAMGRGHTRKRLEGLLNRFRSKIPDIALRTTFVTGFPGETEQAFNRLLEFIQTFRFDRAGVFPYSHEEYTPAYTRWKDEIPQRIKVTRAEKIMEVQQEISLELNRERIGKCYKVLIDRKEGEYFVGRTQYDSPEVDNEVLIPVKQKIKPGEFYQVRITGAEAFDLYGNVQRTTP